jgi:hypothetical protein
MADDIRPPEQNYPTMPILQRATGLTRFTRLLPGCVSHPVAAVKVSGYAASADTELQLPRARICCSWRWLLARMAVDRCPCGLTQHLARVRGSPVACREHPVPVTGPTPLQDRTQLHCTVPLKESSCSPVSSVAACWHTSVP